MVLSNRKGEGYIDVVVGVLVSTAILILIINVFSFLALKQDMDYFAKEMIEAATTNGSTASETAARYNELSEETGLSPDCTWSADYFDSSEKTVQLGDTITVILMYDTKVKGFGVFSISITLTVKHSGLSQKYWK